MKFKVATKLSAVFLKVIDESWGRVHVFPPGQLRPRGPQLRPNYGLATALPVTISCSICTYVQ